MISPHNPKISFSDIILNLGAILLAISSASFATIVIVSGPKTTVSNDNIGGSQSSRGIDESIITGSIGSASKKTQRSPNAVTGSNFGTVYSNYAVRSIDNGIATIDFFEETTVRTIRAQVGNYVDGIGRIKNFVQKDGVWYVMASTK
jgi:hypothetical protein